jgi:phage gp46-like protein
MAGKDRKLDPATGDYIPDGRGGWQYVTTIESEVMHRLRDQADKFRGDPAHGSNLYRIPLEGHLDEVTRLRARRYAEVALQPIVDAGRGARLRTTAVINRDAQPPRIDVDTTIADVQSALADVSSVTKLSVR